jgi:hypothetical protein
MFMHMRGIYSVDIHWLFITTTMEYEYSNTLALSVNPTWSSLCSFTPLRYGYRDCEHFTAFRWDCRDHSYLDISLPCYHCCYCTILRQILDIQDDCYRWLPHSYWIGMRTLPNNRTLIYWYVFCCRFSPSRLLRSDIHVCVSNFLINDVVLCQSVIESLIFSSSGARWRSRPPHEQCVSTTDTDGP